MGAKNFQLSFRCSAELHKILKDLAYENRTSMQNVVDQAISHYLRSKRIEYGPFSRLSDDERQFLEDLLSFRRKAVPAMLDVVENLALVVVDPSRLFDLGKLFDKEVAAQKQQEKVLGRKHAKKK